MGEWLTEQLDRTPFRCTLTGANDLIRNIENKQDRIREYFDAHPRAVGKIFTAEKRQKRFMDNALSYLVLEGGEGIGIVPSRDKTPEQRQQEAEDLARLMAYQDACEFMHDAAVSPDGYLDGALMINAHSKLYARDPESRNFVRGRFRNEYDNEIVVGQGYFDPVPGELVGPRMTLMLYTYHNAWRKDHPIVKGAKFVTEYFRIQPHMDANKRVALMALNFILEQHGYPDIYIGKSQTERFYAALKTGILTRDVTDLATLIAENVEMRCDRIIDEIRDYRIRAFAGAQAASENDDDIENA